MTLNFPLRSERLLVRPFENADLAAAHRVYGDAEAMQFVGEGSPATIDESKQMIEAYRQHQREHGFAFWAVCEVESLVLIGDAGLEITENGVELGYTLSRAWWGKGLATEAARLCIDAAFGPLDLPRLTATADPDNPASARVLTKLGFSPDGEVLAYGRTHHRFILERAGRIGH